MATRLERWFRFLCAAQAGAQLFFAAVAAQVVFPPEVAALPHGHQRRTLAADLVGQMLVRLDATTLIVAAVCVLLGLRLAQRQSASNASSKSSAPGESGTASTSRAPRQHARRALFPLLAGLCALASLLGTTPAIQSLRAQGRTGEPLFGRLHALSSLLLLAELLLFAWAALRKDGITQASLDDRASEV